MNRPSLAISLVERDRNSSPVARQPSQRLHHLKQNELAERWQLSPRTLERWRWKRKGPPFIKVGRRVVYRLLDIEEFEATNTQLVVEVAGGR